jgi:hypothetical protein
VPLTAAGIAPGLGLDPHLVGCRVGGGAH